MAEFYTSLAAALHLSGCEAVRLRGRLAMNRDEIKGKAEKAKGYVKEKAGEVTGNRDLEAEGAAERAGGAVRETIGKVERKVEKVAEDLTDD
jgi:uncharacterized protein YjbJ (UPF0337 family)